MQKIIAIPEINVKTVIYDVIMLTIVTFLSAISHLIGFQLHLIEPSRIIH